jgi:hypothetical protein
MKIMKNISTSLATSMVFLVTIIFPSMGMADGKVPITIKTFVRAETDTAIKNVVGIAGLNTFFHLRGLTPIDKQDVIRMNRDTLYSSAVLDLTKPATVFMPETGDRYQSLHVINQDHYSFAKTKPGTYKLTQAEVGTRYAYLIVRTFIDADDAEDIKLANTIQDQLMIEGGGAGPLDIPDWNTEQVMIARGALNTLAKLGGTNEGGFGSREETDPIAHLMWAAAGWGGLPLKHTSADIGAVAKNDGTPHVLNVKDVPVNAFWSVTVYNADGFIPENSRSIYSYNNVTARPDDDGSFTIYFGGCDDDSKNCLPISAGWNYVIRMYEPRSEILDGSWRFPAIEPVK